MYGGIKASHRVLAVKAESAYDGSSNRKRTTRFTSEEAEKLFAGYVEGAPHRPGRIAGLFLLRDSV